MSAAADDGRSERGDVAADDGRSARGDAAAHDRRSERGDAAAHDGDERTHVPGRARQPRAEPPGAADRTRQQRGERKRALIVEAAARVALVQGIAALSHRAVAAEAGVPLGSTTYYFASLDELAAAAMARLLAGDRERREGFVAGGLPPDADGAAVAWALIRLVIGAGRLDEPRQVALLYERLAEATRSPALAEVMRAGQEEVLGDVSRLVTGTRWSDADPGLLVAVVDGRAIGWLALGAAQPASLLDAVAADLAALAPRR